MCKKTANAVAHVYDFCKEIKQAVDRNCAGNVGVGESPTILPNVPAYTTEQVIALETSLSNAAYYGKLVSILHPLNYFLE